MKKYIVSIMLIVLGVICLSIHGSNSTVAENGMLMEPYFFLVPVSYLLFFMAIVTGSFTFIRLNLKGNK
ncbi:DUF3955 domain-containing protein [Bacillus cereus]|uniref:DUF3955 domain-containing protein n=1 Tax=Bacillus cereus TaxID=1396 RepID=A0A2A8IP10_BACCE|nr:MULTISPECIES: DUF3955 domain-containing protein [Bacillus]MDH4423201.1 DUF3955 domain-containing protein [Bacillus cereus]PER20707.1 DUF3955 domain-containing protein [Bacillus cereus]PFA62526.1 DUF3955 domain-containing protein [Bacillus sp. AFS015896]PGU02211.1 DUF3955 domain-containing protein [Bacillus cereus]PGZ68760.1 DUF3955 domain-containing protein [Bacillus sp. AFS029637]